MPFIPSAALLQSGAVVAQAATVLTSETTSSATYVDLTTPGPAVTVTVKDSGLLLIGIQAQMHDVVQEYMSFELSGANTLAASDNNAVFFTNNLNQRFGVTCLLTGLSAGSTTVTAKYRVSGGAGAFERRHLWAMAF